MSEAQVEQLIGAVCRVVEDMHSSMAFWTEALALVGRPVNL